MNKLYRYMVAFFGQLSYLWIKSKAFPKHYTVSNPEAPFIYILKNASFLDRLVLDYHCRQLKLPRPGKGARLHFIYGSKLFSRFKRAALPSNLDLTNLKQPANLIPVSIFWGRNPGKYHQSPLKLAFFDNEDGGYFQSFFNFIFLGREVSCHFGEKIEREQLFRGQLEVSVREKKLLRVLKIHYRRMRNQVLGPQIYNRQQVILSVLRSKIVRDAIEKEAQRKRISVSKVEKQAARMLREIAADQKHSIVLFFQAMLNSTWKKIYTRTEVKGLEEVQKIAGDHEILYLPCHRSHLDYLLVGSKLYQYGLTVPHMASGINLNFWPIGPFLRKAGAFFLRRSFGGNRLYNACFSQYLDHLVSYGYSISFYPEGGRSRTGKLLKPKTGMLSIVLANYIRNPAKKIALIPTSINYDRLFENKSYLKELSGKTKDKENFLGLLKAGRILKSQMGTAYLHFGKPIYIEDFLNEQLPSWQDTSSLTAKINSSGIAPKLALEINRSINRHSQLTSSGLYSSILLANNQRALSEKMVLDIAEIINDFVANISQESSNVPLKDLPEAFNQAKLNRIFSCLEHEKGNICYIEDTRKQTIQYFRNNVLHIILLPSLLLRLFKYKAQVTFDEIYFACTQILPFFEEDLFLTPHNPQKLHGIIRQALCYFTQKGLLRTDDDNTFRRVPLVAREFTLFQTIANLAGPELEKQAVFAGVLQSFNSQPFSIKSYTESCKLMSNRVALLAGYDHPESFDQPFFNSYLERLKTKPYLNETEEHTYRIDDSVPELYAGYSFLLSEEIKEGFVN